MRIIKLATISFGIFVSSCGLLKKQQQGFVSPTNFEEEFTFQTYKGVIGFDISIDGQMSQFLFDTGADLTLIQRDSILGKSTNYAGASKRKMELGEEIIPSLKIGDVNFQNTVALNGDMVGLKEQIPNFGGILGQSVISKVNWLIDYPNKAIIMSTNSLADNTFKSIKIIRQNGNNPYTFLTFRGKEYKVVIDLGSSSVINLPTDSKFAKDVSATVSLKENVRERYTLGGLQKITEQIGVIPELSIGDFKFENVEFNINTSSQPRIGINFFKDYQIYIDNLNDGVYWLKKTEE
ncbi:MAG: hypothetical protein RLO81_05050 [Fulvivirga sp.]|uniref:hypothetical protein n=1 Tax=Fulvivirga sp. TaxID=1931237 RepID=UPI0032EF8822